MDIPLTQRLSFKQARLTVLLTFVLGTLLSLIQVGVDYASENASINREIRALMEISRQPAARIAYNIDSELAQELVTGLLRSPAVISAEILDNTSNPLAGAERPAVASQYRFISDSLFGDRRVFSQELQVSGDSREQLGQLRLEVDTFVFGSNFLRRATMTMIGGLARTLVLSICLMTLFWFMLTKPLTRVISALSERDLNSPAHSPLPCPVGHAQDEIGVLVKVTNQQLGSIAEHMQQRLDAEQRLTRYLAELESIVSARTAELEATNAHLLRSNQALEEARAQALQAVHARSAFLANMSHEIRTPLNGLLGLLELSLDGTLSAQQRQQLMIASGAGHYLLTLLNDVLDLSKFEAGHLELEQIPFDLGALVEETASLLSQNAANSVYLNCLISPELPSQVLGDPTRVRQIISNLLSNALKFTRNGSVDVEAHALPGAVRLIVRDTGIGIEESMQTHIFQPFTQANAGITREFGGTGLGLPLTRRLCEAMSGQLQLSSTIGQGSVFQVDLPLPAYASPSYQTPMSGTLLSLCDETDSLTRLLAQQLPNWGLSYQQLPADGDLAAVHHALAAIKEPVLLITNSLCLASLRSIDPHLRLLLVAPHSELLSEPQQQLLAPFEQVPRPLSRNDLHTALQRLLSNSRATNPSPPSDRRTAQILLVEDNPVNQMVTRGMLEKLGCQVALACDGNEALEYLARSTADLVLMDCNMPQMDGYEATRRIRLQPELQHLPVIALTANGLSDERARCVAAGMNDYLSKPFSRDALTQLLSRWLPNHCRLPANV